MKKDEFNVVDDDFTDYTIKKDKKDNNDENDDKITWFGRHKKSKFEEYEFDFDNAPMNSEEVSPKVFEHTGEIDLNSGKYLDLFSDSDEADDQRLNFDRIKRERRKRIKRESEISGVDYENMADEYGIVAPIPVTSQEFGTMDLFDFQKDFQKHIQKTKESYEKEPSENIIAETSVENDDFDYDSYVKDNFIEEVKEEIVEETFEQPVEEIVEEVIEQPVKETTEEPVSAEKLFENAPVEEESVAEEIQEEIQEEIVEETAETTEEQVETIEEVNETEVEEPTQEVIDEEPVDEVQQEEPVVQVEPEPVQEPTPVYVSKEPDEELPGDYKSVEDAKNIFQKLKTGIAHASLRALITTIIAIIMLIITIVSESQFKIDNTEGDPGFYIYTSLIAIVATAVVCLKPLISGVKNIINYKTNADSFVSIATIAVFLQIIFSFFNKEGIVNGTAHVYAIIPVLGWSLNSIGKLSSMKRIYSNFRYVASNEQKYTLEIYDDYEVSLKLTKDILAEKPVIAYQKKTAFLKRFLQLSKQNDPSDKVGKNIVPACFVLSILLYIVVLIKEQDLFKAMNMFAACACMSMPIANIISVQFPFSSICNKLRRTGSMISNIGAIKQISNINCVAVDSSDVYPANCISIEEIYDFADNYSERSMIMAANLLKEAGGTYGDIGREMLPEQDDRYVVQEMVIEPKYGVSGIVNGARVHIGTMDLMKREKLVVPVNEEFNNLIDRNVKVLFIAVDFEIISAVEINYRADKRKKLEFAEMQECGISLVVRSLDPNISKEMLIRDFALSPSTVNVVNNDLCKLYEDLVCDEEEKSDAIMATKGRIESFVSLVTTAHKNKRLISLITVIQVLGIIMGMTIATIMSFCGGITQLSSIGIFLYLAFWVVVSMLVSKFRSL